MNEALHLSLGWQDWLQLFLHFITLSMMSVGGAIATAPEMHRYLVLENQWLNEAQFNASISIAQASPGPNVLFVALMGWNVGVNAGSIANAALGMTVAMVGILLPSTTITYTAARWGHRNRELRAVRAFKLGLAPIVIALLITTGWILASAQHDPATDWRLWLVTLLATLVLWKTRLHLLWLLAAGALLGWWGIL
jgi:chromate transporter